MLRLDRQIQDWWDRDGVQERMRFPDLSDTSSLIACRAQRSQTNEAALSQIDRAGVLTTVETIPGGNGRHDLRIRVHRPVSGGANLPCLYFVHGGGMIMGNARFDDSRLLPLVRRFGCVATSIEYRLAPETAAPGLAEDCFAGLQWLVANADALKIDPALVVVGGVSGGGGLAAITAIMARDRGIDILLQWLLCPQLDDRHVTPSSLVDWPVWPSRCSIDAWKAVLGDRYGSNGVTAYDAAARIQDMTGLAPVFLDVSDMEVFRDECVDYAARLVRAGVATEFHLYRGGCHLFDVIVPDAVISRLAAETRNAALARAWSRV